MKKLWRQRRIFGTKFFEKDLANRAVQSYSFSVNKIDIVNLTPHAVTLHGVDGKSVTLPPSGQVARLAVTREPMPPVIMDGVTLAVSRPTLGAVTDLPDAQPGILLLVSALVADAVRRGDVVSPGELVRDAAGVITGARGICSYV